MVMMPVFHPGILCLYDILRRKRFSMPDLTVLLVLKEKVEIVKSLTGVILLFPPFRVEPKRMFSNGCLVNTFLLKHSIIHLWYFANNLILDHC